MKAVNVDEVLKILQEYGKYIFVTDDKKYSSMVDEIANLKAIEPQPMVEIDLDYVIKQKYIEREVLDKIKAEIRQQQWYLGVANVNRVIGIIDKYTAESEEV